MIRIGILGASQVAPYALIEPVTLRGDCEISVIACRDRERGEVYAKLYDIPVVVTDYLEMVRRNDVDLVYNCLPPFRHADLSIAALEYGKTVLCEKPFAMNAMDAQKMADASNKADIPLIEAFHYRYHPAFVRMLDIIKSGQIGKVHKINACFVAPVPFEEGEVRHTLSIGGGSLMDMGCYPIHWCRMIAESEPEVVGANCFTQSANIDISTTAELSFNNGITASIECSMDANRKFEAWISVFGENGKIYFENPLGPHNGHFITTEQNGIKRTETVAGRRSYDYQLEHVIDIMKGNVKAIGGGSDSVANMVVVDSIYRAAGLTPR